MIRRSLHTSCLLLAALVVLSGCTCSRRDDPPNRPRPRHSLRVGPTTVQVELAVRPDERRMGFMYRDTIPEGTGMLFVFEEQEPQSFWMKNTPTPLSIAFADKTGRILRIADMQPYSHTSVPSIEPALYALEVPQGWFKKNNIVPGTYIKLDEEIREAIRAMQDE